MDLNACPPLLVGVGVATSVETAALLSKKALMRPIGSHNENERCSKDGKTYLKMESTAIGLRTSGYGRKISQLWVLISRIQHVIHLQSV